MVRTVSNNDSVIEIDLIDALERALSLARKDQRTLTAHLLEMAILNESRAIFEQAAPHGQA